MIYLGKRWENAWKSGYTLKDMIKGIWLSDWPKNITPRFMRFYYSSKDTLEFVRDVIEEVLGALGVNIPQNIDLLIAEGRKLVNELEEKFKEDTEKMLSRLKGKK